MEKKFRSINFKVWRSMLIVIVIFFSTVLIINYTIIRKIESGFVFENLEETSKLIKTYKNSSSIENKYIGLPQILNFEIEREKGRYSSIIDPFITELVKKEEKKTDAFKKIVNNIEKYNNKNKDILEYNKELIFYYIDWKNRNKKGTVFFVIVSKNTDLEIELFLGMLVLFMMSFFISKVISKKIANPVQKLKLFAEEIAKRNWNAEVPKTDNDEIGVLTKSLEKMRDSLRIYEEKDRQFLQSTSHDLKTPVMVIKGYAQSMIDGIKINSEQTQPEIIKVEAERLERKINQLLKLNTLSHSLEYNKNKEYIRIDRILKNLISKFKVIRADLNWEINLKEIELLGDSEAFLIAFENILENQIRFSKSLISIKIKQGKRNEIIISNDGPHFEVKDPNVLFETYMKDKAGKFGLGLSIVKQIIKAHNGSIEAYNTKEGVEFKILL